MAKILLRPIKKRFYQRFAEFDPEMLFISAGFDAHVNDPLANLNFTTNDFKILLSLIHI